MGAPQQNPNAGSEGPHYDNQGPNPSFIASPPPLSGPFQSTPSINSQGPPAYPATSLPATVTELAVSTTLSNSQITGTVTSTSIPALAGNQQLYTMVTTTSSTITNYQPPYTKKQQYTENQQDTSSQTQSATRATIPSSPTRSSLPSQPPNSENIWDHLGRGAQTGIVIVVLLGVFTIVALSVWFCCGCCGLRRRRQKRLESRHSGTESRVESQPIPLNPVVPGAAPGYGARGGEAPPPRYEEVVPPSHQTIAGGITHVRSEEEEGVVADGKTPLSEIPFEDVVLDRTNGEGSSRTFEERHYTLGGDTRGHTNS